MLERNGQILRILCFALAAYLAYELVHITLRGSLLSRVTIPELPTLSSDTNVPAGRSGTNAPKSTAKGTNALASKSTPAAGTNLTTAAGHSATATNLATTGPSATNEGSPGVPAQTGLAENVAPEAEHAGASTNAESKVEIAQPSNSAATQAIAAVASQTNGSNVLLSASATNLQASATVSNSSVISTNSLSNAMTKVRGDKKSGKGVPPGAMAMAGGMHFPGMPGKGLPTLPPEIKARVDRIYESEMFGQIIRMPMGLLGIAGDYAIIRSPTGQTGLVKLGDSLGDIKLLRIGINRVLVEQDGHQQELMIFNGYGGQSLLTNENKIPK